MKLKTKYLLLILVLAVLSCANNEEKKAQIRLQSTKTQNNSTSIEDQLTEANTGIGPVTTIVLNEDVDVSMAHRGEALFKSKCTACHSPDYKLIGPAPKGVLDRRTPEWVMNMILNPEIMLKQDPIAKQLLIEYKNIPMINQNLKEEEAREILEYFRTL